MATERKNIKRNNNRRGVASEGHIQGVGFGRSRFYFATGSLTEYEKWLLRKGLY